MNWRKWFKEKCKHSWKHMATIREEYDETRDIIVSFSLTSPYHRKGCIETAILQCEICSELKKIKANEN